MFVAKLFFLDQQTIQFDFSISTLFVFFTSIDLKLSVHSLHPKQYIIPTSFPVLSVLLLIECFSCHIFLAVFF